MHANGTVQPGVMIVNRCVLSVEPNFIKQILLCIKGHCGSERVVVGEIGAGKMPQWANCRPRVGA